jgi:hypothetical protein
MYDATPPRQYRDFVVAAVGHRIATGAQHLMTL